MRMIRVLVSLVMASLLAACAPENSGSSAGEKNQAISGNVEGGRQPIAGSLVTIYATSLIDGDPATEIAQALTDANGNFHIASFNPAPVDGQVIYVVAAGGDAGGGDNPAAVLVDVMGVYCSGACGFPTHANINELTTAAASTVLGSQLAEVSCATIVSSSGSAPCINLPASAGLAALVAQVTSLVSPATGTPSSTLTNAADGTPDNTTLRTLNTLASVLASCVNSAGPGVGSTCNDLFSAAGGGTDTLGAALAFAGQPDQNAAIAAYFALLPPSQVFQPVLTSAPSDSTHYLIIVNGGDQLSRSNSNQVFNKIGSYLVNDSSGLVSRPNTIMTSISPEAAEVSPDGRVLYLPDFLTAPDFHVYSIPQPSGALTSLGVVHSHGTAGYLKIGGNGFAYLAAPFGDLDINNLPPDFDPATAKGQIILNSVDPVSGSLTPISTVDALLGVAYMALTPDGRFAYVIAPFTADGVSKIVAYGVDATTGELTPIDTTGLPVGDVSRLMVITPDQKFAYVVNQNTGTVFAYAIDSGTGGLTYIDAYDVGDPADSNPSALTLSPDGRFLYVPHFGTNPGVDIFSVEADGTLSTMTPYIDAVDGSSFLALTPDGTKGYFITQDGVRELDVDTVTGALTPFGTVYAGPGLTRVIVAADGATAYLFGTESILRAAISPTTGALDVPGWGVGSDHPFAGATSPNGKFIYVLDGDTQDLNVQRHLLAYSADPASGQLTLQSTTPVWAGINTLAITDKFIYIATDYQGTVDMFAIDPVTGALSGPSRQTLTDITSGEIYDLFVADPNGKFLYARYSKQGVPLGIQAFSIDPLTGELIPAALSANPDNPNSPYFSPDGLSLYVISNVDGGIDTYSVDQGTGALTLQGHVTAGLGTYPVMARTHDGRFFYSFTVSADGNTLNLSTSSVDPGTGVPTVVQDLDFHSSGGIPSPGLIQTSDDDRFVYVTDLYAGGNLYVYRADPVLGTLTQIEKVGLPASAVVFTFPH